MSELVTKGLAASAAYINAEHGAALEAAAAAMALAGSALEHGRNAGQELLAVKGRLGERGGIGEFIRENLRFSERTARDYMRVAEGWDRLPYRQRAAGMCIRKAIAFLSAEPEPEEAETSLVEEIAAPEPQGASANGNPGAPGRAGEQG
jgi:hypothetical protein